MNKIHLCVLPLALLLAASSGESVAGEPRTEPDPACKGERQDPIVNLNLKTKEANPECVKARLGSIIVFKLTPKKGLENVTVSIEPEDDFKDAWLKGENDYLDDLVIIRVPGDYDPKSKHEYTDHIYSVVVSDETIDPRVEVEH